MIKSNATIREINDSLIKPVGTISPISYNSQVGVGFIGNIPL